MARWPSKAKSDWKLRRRAGSFQRKSLERGMFARAMACGLCWSWLWVACAGAAHMPATTTADTASNDNRHGLPLTLTPPIAGGPPTGGLRAAEGHEPKPARCTAVAGTRSAPTEGAAREHTHRRRAHRGEVAFAPPLPLAWRAVVPERPLR